MAHSAGHDLGGVIPVVRQAFAIASVTAAGGGDSTSATGASVDLTALGARFGSAALLIGSSATVTSGLAFSVKAQIQTSVNDSDWTNHTSVATLYTQTATGAALTNARSGAALSVDLSKVGRYIRAVVTPDLTHAGTDTATIGGVWAFGNPDRFPAVA